MTSQQCFVKNGVTVPELLWHTQTEYTWVLGQTFCKIDKLNLGPHLI